MLPNLDSVTSTPGSSQICNDDSPSSGDKLTVSEIFPHQEKRPKLTHTTEDDTVDLKDVEELGQSGHLQPSLMDLSSELRVQIIKHYMEINNATLEGDWSYECQNFPQKSSLPLLRVNKIIRDEATPVAREILVVLPRYLEIKWRGSLLAGGVPGVQQWWTNLQTFYVTRWDQLAPAIFNMPNLRKTILNWHVLLGDHEMPEQPRRQENEFGLVSVCLTDEEINLMLLSPAPVPGRDEPRCRDFWSMLRQTFGKIGYVVMELSIAATIFVRCGTVDVLIDISDMTHWDSDDIWDCDHTFPVTKVNLVKGAKSDPDCCASECIGIVRLPDRRTAAPYLVNNRVPDPEFEAYYNSCIRIPLRSPVTEHDVAQWLCLEADERMELEWKYKLMETLSFKKRIWTELSTDVKRICYREHSDFALGSDWQRLRRSFPSFTDTDKDPDGNSIGTSIWATRVHNRWRPEDHPEYMEEMERAMPIWYAKGDDSYSSRSNESWNDMDRVDEIKNKWHDWAKTEEDKAGKHGFGPGIFESDRPELFPVLDLSDRAAVIKHDGMIWARYQAWTVMGTPFD